MKKNLLVVLTIGAAFILASCGGVTKPEAELEDAKKLKDDYVAQLEKRNEIAQDWKEASDEFDKKWEEEAKSILEDYKGSIDLEKGKNEPLRDLEEKIEDTKGDEEHVKVWIDYMVAERKMELEAYELDKKYSKKLKELDDIKWAYNTSERLFRLIDSDNDDLREYLQDEIDDLNEKYYDIMD